MLKFKTILLIALVVPGTLALSCRESENREANAETLEVIPIKAGEKINWAPVWDDNEGHHEFVIKYEEKEDNENCDAPNGLGLQNFLKQAKKLIPIEQIKAIVKSYAEDPEIKALKAFVQNPQTKEKVKAIQNSLEYKILRNYACRVLHIDLLRYNRLARSVIEPILQRSDNLKLKGIRGLIQEIYKVMPLQQLRDLYYNLLATDEELVKAVDNLKSSEFHQLLFNVKNNVPEFKVLSQELSALGVPVEDMKDTLTDTLGLAPELEVLF